MARKKPLRMPEEVPFRVVVFAEEAVSLNNYENPLLFIQIKLKSTQLRFL
jgi:hypothetical protein